MYRYLKDGVQRAAENGAVRLPRPLMRQVARIAAAEGMTIREFVVLATREFVKAHREMPGLHRAETTASDASSRNAECRRPVRLDPRMCTRCTVKYAQEGGLCRSCGRETGAYRLTTREAGDRRIAKREASIVRVPEPVPTAARSRVVDDEEYEVVFDGVVNRREA